MKRLTKIMALLLSMTLLLTGCFFERDSVSINSDGSLNIELYLEAEKEVMDTSMKALGITDPVAFLGTEGMEEFKDAKYEVITKDDGKEYYALTTNQSYSTMDEYLKTVASEFSLDYMTKDTFYTIKNMEDYGIEQLPGQDMSTSVSAEIRVNFPAPVVSTTGKIDPENPNTAIFTLDVYGKNEYFATTNSKVTLKDTIKKAKALYSVKAPKITSVKTKKITKKKASVTIKYKKIKGASYFVEWATNKKFTKNYNYKETKKTKLVINKLKPGKKYYFRVQAIKTNKYDYLLFSDYSKVKTLKIKKYKAKKK